MLIIAFTLLTCVAIDQSEPQWIAPTKQMPAGPEPRWIWFAEQSQPQPSTQNAAQGVVWFAKRFDAPADIGSPATLSLAADNSATAYLNGTRVLEARDWSAPVFAELALAPGSNLLVIEARNGPLTAPGPGPQRNPAGMIARVQFPRADGSSDWIVTDSSWIGATVKWPGFPSSAPAAGDSNPSGAASAIDLGPASIAPWSLKRAAFEPAQPCPLLRRAFTIEAPPRSAKITLIGLGHYELRCNGQRVGDSLLNQSWSQYSKTLYTQEFDLLPYLRAGENVLGVALGNSFWKVEPANASDRFTKTDAMPDFAGDWPHLLWADLRIDAADAGSATRIVSDERWKWLRGPVTFSNVYAGEDFDARRVPSGWDGPQFDDSAWQLVQSAPPPVGNRVALDGPTMKTYEVFQPTEIKPIAPGVNTYIFPQNCSALLRFTLDGGAAGARVRFRPCEYIEPSGRVKFTYTWNTGKDIWLDYTKAGAGSETHQPLFFYVGAQFVQVDGAVPPDDPNPGHLPVLRSLELVHVRAACPGVGSFDCSSSMHVAADRLIDWSIRSNMSHFPTDCPHREKNSWIEQDWHMARAMSYRYDVNAWLTKTCRDIRDTQQPDGHVPTNSPNYLVGVPPHGYWNNAPEWGIASVLVPWHLYEWYGNRQVLADAYPAARRYVEYLNSVAKDGIIGSNLGDWYDFGHGKGNGPSQWTPNEVSATAIFAYGAKTLARMASALGHVDDAHRYESLFVEIRGAFQRRFYDAASATVKHNGSCQAGTSAALCIGLIPDSDRDRALDAVIDDLRRREWHQTPGEVLQVFLIRALAENGRTAELHRIYNREDIPSYGHMVKSGLTTLPESWDARRGTGDSLNHFMLGHLLEWHFAYVAGIRQQPDSVGWSRILIAPQPPSPADSSPHAMRGVTARFNSPRGLIVSSWNITDNNEFVLAVDLPVGVEAVAVMPGRAPTPISAGKTTLRQPWPPNADGK